jgi:hypothetical protein
MGDEIVGGECGGLSWGARLVGRTHRFIRKVDAAWARVARGPRRSARIRGEIACCRVKHPCSMWPKSDAAAESMLTEFNMRSGHNLTDRNPLLAVAVAGRVCLSRAAFPRGTTGPFGQVYAGAIGDCFRKRANDFRQKIIWVLRSSRVQFTSGTNRRSQATLSRKITRVSQPNVTATGD